MPKVDFFQILFLTAFIRIAFLKQISGAAADVVGVGGCGFLQVVEEVFEAYPVLGVNLVEAYGYWI